MKRIIILILSVCTCLFSMADANHYSNPATNKDLYRIAMEMATDPEYRKALKQTVVYHQQLIRSNSVNDIKILGTGLASEREWESFLVKLGFNNRDAFFQYTDQILEAYNKVFSKHMNMLNFTEKKEVMDMAARIYCWKVAQKNKTIEIDCMSAYMAANSFCFALWELQSGQGNPLASANFAFCMSTNATLYQVCALIFN